MNAIVSVYRKFFKLYSAAVAMIVIVVNIIIIVPAISAT